MVIFSINQLSVWSIKHENVVKKAHRKFPETKISPKPKDIQFLYLLKKSHLRREEF